MALHGEPLGGQHGVLAYAVQDAWGTPKTPNICAGITNLDSTENPDPDELAGIGSYSTQFVRYKGQKNEASVNIAALQTLAFIACGVRALGVLPVLTVGYGLVDDAGAKWAKVYQDCMLNSIEVSWEQEGPIAATASLYLGKRVVSTALARPTALTEAPFAWIDAIVSIGEVGHLTKSGRLGIENNLVRDYPTRATAAPANEARLPYRMRPGREKISFELVTYQTLGIDRQVDVPTSTLFGLALTSRADEDNAAAFDLSGAVFADEHHTADADGDMVWTNKGIACAIALS